MLRIALGLCLVIAASVSASTDLSCIRSVATDAVLLEAAARPIAPPPLAPGDTRVAIAVQAVPNCAVASGTPVAVLGRDDGRALVRVLEGPSAECVGELPATEVGACAAPAPVKQATLRPAPKPVSAPARVFRNRAAIVDSPTVAKWRTAEGRIFFGDRPPAGSTRLGEVAVAVEVRDDDPWRPLDRTAVASSASAAVGSDAAALSAQP